MTTVFISGSMGIKNLDKKIVQKIDSIIERNHKVIVGDASGVDSSIQKLLKQKEYKNVTVFCSGNTVRNNIGKWPVNRVVVEDKTSNARLFYTAKDLQMAKTCDVGFMVWDSKSTGTLSNVLELLKQQKNSLVFINKLKGFKKVCNLSDFEELVSIMNNNSLEKADKKIRIKSKISTLKQMELFPV